MRLALWLLCGDWRKRRVLVLTRPRRQLRCWWWTMQRTRCFIPRQLQHFGA